MSSIVIPRNIDHDIIEDLLTSLDRQVIENVDLQIPAEVVYRGFGMLTGLWSVVFKWMRTKTGVVVVDIDKQDADRIEKFASGYFAYLILSTVWTTSKIVDNKGNDIKKIVREYTATVFHKIDFLEGLPNNEVLLPCFDHYSREKGLPHWLYPNHSNFAATPSVLQNTVYRIFEVLGKVYKVRITKTIASYFDDIEAILWELLKNTDEHAKRDYLNQVNLSPNTRGVLVRLNQSSKEKFIENANENSGVANYFNNALEDGDNLILELTVFDSGPGLARRFLGEAWKEDIAIEEEVGLIKRCLAKGATSVKNWEGELKGYGLNDVLRLLSERKGFLKIRSGRVAIYRDLLNQPFIDTSDHRQISLMDWEQHLSTDFTIMATSEGTQITMVFPLTK